MSFPGKMLVMSLRAGLFALLLSVIGCGTPSPGGGKHAAGTGQEPAPDLLRVGDPVVVTFAGISTVPGVHSERVKEDGTLTLPLNLRIKAVGKSPGQLQEEIYNLYVPAYYKSQLTVTVQTENRFYWVNGEVKLPQRIVYSGETTVVRAIASAGGFTDFANRRRVVVTRANGEKLVVDCTEAINNSSADQPVYPGDRIDVARRLF